MSETPSVPPELEEKLAEQAITREALEEARQKAEDLYNQLLRLRAEFDNYRKRVEKEKHDYRRAGKEEVLLELVRLMDVFDQAMAYVRSTVNPQTVSQGLEMLQQGFARFLKAEGIVPIETVGKPFDPALAEAVEQVDVTDGPEGHVVEEVQKGYEFQGRLLRPAKVKVVHAKKEREV